MDITKLEGYRADMTAEEKLALVDSYSLPDTSGLLTKEAHAEAVKAAIDKATKEAADLKRQLKEKMTDDERKEAERAAAEADKDSRLAEAEKKLAVIESKAQFMALGYDEKLAADTAEALAAGDMAKVYANQKTYIENVRKAERAAVLAGDNEPPAGRGKPGNGTRDALIAQYNEAEKKGDVMAMDALERQIKQLKE